MFVSPDLFRKARIGRDIGVLTWVRTVEGGCPEDLESENYDRKKLSSFAQAGKPVPPPSWQHDDPGWKTEYTNSFPNETNLQFNYLII